MKANSKILGILAALFVIAIVISSAGAGNLANSENFVIDIPDGSDFKEMATTDLDVGDVDMKMLVFENSGNNSDDISTIIYMKDSSNDSSMISDLYNDLKKDCEVVEEKDNYIVFKTQNSNDVSAEDIEDAINSFMGIAEDIFSSDADMNFSADGNSISFSDKGLEISDANGDNVSISSEGIKVSEAPSSDGEVSEDVNITVNGNADASFQNGEYTVYIKNAINDQVIVINGNDLEVMKKMADTVSFGEN